MRKFRLEIEDQDTVEFFSVSALMQEFTRRVVRGQIPEGAECHLWECPREKWRMIDGWIFRKEKWT